MLDKPRHAAQRYLEKETKLTGLLFDWSGTIVDFGSRAPAKAFMRAFEESSIQITEAEARAPMGLSKWEHIESILRLPRVTKIWNQIYTREWTNIDIAMIYERYLPLQAETAAAYSGVVPGAIAAFQNARARGLKIGVVSDYPEKVTNLIAARARGQGLEADAYASAGDTPMGQPLPFLLYKIALELELGAIWRCVAIGDTPIGIEAARKAGAWTVGVAISGNAVGLSPEEWLATGAIDRGHLRKSASESLNAAGPHFVIDSITGLSAVLTRLASRLARGERP